VLTGNTAVLTCISSVKPIWKKHRNSFFDYKIISNYDGERETIAIASIQSTQEGVYYCIGKSLMENDLKGMSLWHKKILQKMFEAVAEIYVGG